jgi:hypothetical protein
MHTLQVCILLTVYRIQLFKQMEQIVHSRAYLGKNYFGYTELFSIMCVCVCVPTNKQENIFLEQGPRDIFRTKRKGVVGRWKNLRVRSCMICPGVWMVVGVEFKDSGTDRKGEIKNMHKISVWNPERMRHFGRSKPRWNVQNNVMNCTERTKIPVAFRSVKYKFFLRIISSANGKKVSDD